MLEQAGVDIIVCDDGLQHYALQRDIELVVMDGVRRLGNGWLMPMGPLRESASRMRNVLAVICNGGQARPDEIQMTLQPAPLCNVKTGRVAVVTGAVDAMAAGDIVTNIILVITIHYRGHGLILVVIK